MNFLVVRLCCSGTGRVSCVVYILQRFGESRFRFLHLFERVKVFSVINMSLNDDSTDEELFPIEQFVSVYGVLVCMVYYL